MTRLERPSHPIDLASDAGAVFQFASAIDALREEDVYGHSNRNAIGLVHDDGLRAVLTVAKAGTECDDHAAREPTMIVTLSGRLSITGGEGAGVIQVPEGSAAVLAPGVRHRLVAVTDCAYLLIVGSRPA